MIFGRSKLSSAQIMLYDKELDRVRQHMQRIQGTYSGMMTWSIEDIEEMKKLKARKAELEKMLGVQY